MLAGLRGLDRDLAGVVVVPGLLGVVAGRHRAALRGAGRVPLLERVHRKTGRDQHQRGQRGNQVVQPPGAPPLGLLPDVLLILGHRDELAVQRAQAGRVAFPVGPFQGRLQRPAAQQRGVVPGGLRPGPGRLADPPPDPQVLVAVVDPAAQPRPRGQQRVVRELGGAWAGADQPGPDEPVQQVPGRRAGQPAAGQVGQPHRAAGLRRVVGHVHQPQEQLPGQVALVRVQVGVHPLGGPRDRVLDPAAGHVVRHRQPPAVTVLPGGQQRVRQQRQRAWLVRVRVRAAARGPRGQVGQQQLDQPVGHGQPGQPGRPRIAERTWDGDIGPSTTCRSCSAAASCG